MALRTRGDRQFQAGLARWVHRCPGHREGTALGRCGRVAIQWPWVVRGAAWSREETFASRGACGLSESLDGDGSRHKPSSASSVGAAPDVGAIPSTLLVLPGPRPQVAGSLDGRTEVSTFQVLARRMSLGAP